MTKSKIMEDYYAYMGSNEKLKVGTYESVDLASICGINLPTLIFLGAMANAQEAPVQLKTGWYIYSLEERILRGGIKYYITIDNNLKYI